MRIILQNYIPCCACALDLVLPLVSSKYLTLKHWREVDASGVRYNSDTPLIPGSPDQVYSLCVEQEAFESESYGRGFWHWKTLPLYLDLCCGAGSTFTTQLCRFMSYVCVTQKRKPGIDLWLWRQLSQGNSLFTLPDTSLLWSRLAMCRLCRLHHPPWWSSLRLSWVIRYVIISKYFKQCVGLSCFVSG